MKEQLHNVLQNIKKRQPKTLIIITASLLLVIATTAVYSGMIKGSDTADTVSSDTTTSEDASIVATFGVNGTSTESLVSNNSWPGELVSADISQIQPQRMGTLTDWNVHIGDYVYAGQVIGRISAPPATPELIKMLAEQTEARTMARSQVIIADEYATKEQLRLNGLKNSLENNNASSSDQLFTALLRLREKVDIKKKALRAFVEQAISTHVTTISNSTTWRSFSYSTQVDQRFGSLDQTMQYNYKVALSSLIDSLKNSQDVSIEDSQNYFNLLVRFANNSTNETDMNDFKVMASKDQNEFLMFLAEYRDAEAMLADKETEYKIMISEKGAMIEKDRSMAYASAKASEAAYNTVAGQITGTLTITSPRSGTVSAIYKKVGDLVAPEMAIAVIAGKDNTKLTVRIRIPSNTNRPVSGDMVSVIRPGYTKDIRQAKVLGVGTTLDETGSYLADAILVDTVEWPVGSSVRVVPVKSSNTPSIKASSVFWSEGGIPHIWAVTDAGRIFAKKITIGRTLGDSIEITDGLKNGEKYITDGSLDITENMFVDDLLKKTEPTEATESKPTKSKKVDHSNMPGM